ncbi:hypothetical protein HNP40_001218 [Mycobacteroides chelonae]|nr:hypothetical protein [Mycobacteroides chelonae]
MTAAVGCGFITWTLKGNEQALDHALERNPAAGVTMICQVHTVRQALRAVEVGTVVIAAQGGEAGGHGAGQRSTFTLVPEIADLVASTAPQVLVLADGGETGHDFGDVHRPCRNRHRSSLPVVGRRVACRR